ncbi:hypothetical protein [Georgfuchsia toluolica]|uniref:hypothetical protein n=1 Tax=Georgfuchsia toluolica TaxID=424218 RepID=UPI001C737FCE|nr:hypothetical protein [Georgfuchsia toluolica]
MKPRTMHTDPLAFSTSIIIMRMHAYIRTYRKSYKPTSKGRAIMRRNARRAGTGKAAWKR